jgi:very-short-patch-repair endonuclease
LKKSTLQEFIEKARKVHGNKYDYSKVEYKNTRTKVCIICPEHGEFWQRPDHHLNLKHGCPKCNESQGEKSVVYFLLENNILFERQKRFDECRNKNPLPFDFYLPEHNILIEYDGEQHYRSIDTFGGKKRFQYLKNNDAIKNDFCKSNNMKLLRIPYWEINNISEIFEVLN